MALLILCTADSVRCVCACVSQVVLFDSFYAPLKESKRVFKAIGLFNGLQSPAGGAGGAGALVVLLVTAIEQLACSFALGLTAPTLARLPRWCWRCCRCWAREEVEKRREEEAAAAPPAKGAEAAPATVSLALPALPKLVFPVGLVGFAAAWLLVLGVCQVQLQGAAPPLAALHGGGAVGMGAGAALLPQAM